MSEEYQEIFDGPWYKVPLNEDEHGRKPHDKIHDYIGVLQQRRTARMEQAANNCRLFDDRAELKHDRIACSTEGAGYTKENVARSVINTALALVAANPVRTMALTTGADFSLQRRAKKMTRYLDGLDEQRSTHEDILTMVLDGMLVGSGFVEVMENKHVKTPTYDRCMLDEILVDEELARNGKTDEMHRVKWTDYDVLIRKYPDHKQAILAAKEARYENGAGMDEAVKVVRSWKLPSEPGAGDGRYAMTIGGATFVYKKYERMEFPIKHFRWSRPSVGYYGTSLMDEAAGMQMEIEELIDYVATAIRQFTFPMLAVQQQDASQLKKLKPMPGVGLVMTFKDTPAQILAQRPVSPDIVNRIDHLIQHMYRLTGVGEMAAHARKPPDVRSAEALSEVRNVESQRFILQFQEINRVKIELSREDIYVSKKMMEKGGAPKVVWRAKNMARQIDWSEVSMEDDAYTLSMMPVGITSLTPQGRFDRIMNLVERGLIPHNKALKLLDMPDVEHETELEIAEALDIDACIENLRDEKDEEVDDVQNLELMLPRIKQAYLLDRRAENVPAGVLAGYREWIRDATAIIQARMPEIPPEGGPPSIQEEALAAQAASERQAGTLMV